MLSWFLSVCSIVLTWKKTNKVGTIKFTRTNVFSAFFALTCIDKIDLPLQDKIHAVVHKRNALPNIYIYIYILHIKIHSWGLAIYIYIAISHQQSAVQQLYCCDVPL